MKSLKLIILFTFLVITAKADFSAHPVNKWMNGNCQTTFYIITTGDAGPFTVDIEKDGTSVFNEENLPSDVKMVSIPDYGQFTVIFTDAFGCSTELIVDALCDCDDLEYNITPSSCHLDNGSIEIMSPMGAMMTSEWTQWPTGTNAPADNALVVNNLVPGIYIATFKINIPDPISGDFIYCEFDESFDLSSCNCELELDESLVIIEGTTSCDQPNGFITIDIYDWERIIINHSGTTAYLQFTWKDGSGTIIKESNQFHIEGLDVGFYDLIVTDISGCEVIQKFEIRNELEFDAGELITNPCNNLENGSISLGANVKHNDGFINQDFSYLWSTGSEESYIVGLESGTYYATLTEEVSGCTYERMYTLENKSSSPIEDVLLSELEPPYCEGKSTQGDLTIIGGQWPFEIKWSPNFNQNNTLIPRFWESGTYQVTVEDYCDNSFSKTFEVIVPEVEYEEITNLKVDKVIDCKAYNGTTTLTFEGGAPFFEVSKKKPFGQGWKKVATSNDEVRTFTVPYDGPNDTYKVEDGCGDEMQISVTWPPKSGSAVSVVDIQHCHPDKVLDGNGIIIMYGYYYQFVDISLVSESGSVMTNLVYTHPEKIVAQFECLNPGVYEILFDNGSCYYVVDEVEILPTGTNTTDCIVIDDTCEDGIQNGNETGIDCGGPDCDACGGDVNNGGPIKCNDFTVSLNSYSGEGSFIGNLEYNGPAPSPSQFITIIVEDQSGWPVHSEQFGSEDGWDVSFNVDISDENSGDYDIYVELPAPDYTKCFLTTYFFDPNIETGNLCGFDVNYDLNPNGGEVVDARLLLSHGLGEDDQISIIPFDGVLKISSGLHITFWQGDHLLSTNDCDNNTGFTDDPFTLVSDEDVRVEIHTFRFPDPNDMCTDNAQWKAIFELDCGDNFNSPNDDCNEFLVSNFGDVDYLVEHNTLSNNQNSVPPHVILSPLTMNGGVVSSNTIVSNNTSNFILGRDVLSTSNSFNNERLAYQSFNMGEDTLGDLQTLVDIAEAGSSTYAHFTFDTPFADIPIILPTLVQVDGDKGLEIQLKDVSRYGFKIKLRDVENVLNGSKREVSFIAIEEGETSIGGRKVVVGKTLNDINHIWTNISFPNNSGQSFPENHMPYFFAFPQTSYGAGSPFVMYQNLSQDGVEISLVSADEYITQGSFSNQEVGYLILGVDTDCICDNPVTDIDYEMVSPNCGMNNGQLEFKPIGGTPPYDFKVNGSIYLANATGSVELENLTDGTYHLEILDSKGCLYEEEIILVADELNLDDYLAENVECSGSEFNLILNPLGGTPPYSYTWNNGNNTEELKSVSQGHYYVTVVDADGCIGTRHFNLRNMYLSVSKEDASCDLNNGSLAAQPIGVAPFEYEWSTGESTFKIENLAPGQYSVTVTDAAGCTKSANKVILPDGQSDLEYEHPFCGTDNGYVELLVDGIAPINYLWNTGHTTNKINNLGPGTYSVTATDATGCISVKSITLNNTNSISLSESGGNEGFNDGKFIPAGVTVNWSFNPASVTDQLIISSDEYGVIVNTGGVTRRQESCCSNNSCCSDFFLGDFSNSPIELIVGSGFVLEGVTSSSGCIYSGYLTGSFTTQVDGYITVEVIGANCGGSTAWSAAMSCSENTNSILAVMEATEVTNVEQELALETEEIISNSFSIFPNPANSIIYIDSYAQIEDASLRIIDVHGKTILKSKIENSREVIDVSHIPNGIYFIIIESSSSLISERVVINR